MKKRIAFLFRVALAAAVIVFLLRTGQLDLGKVAGSTRRPLLFSLALLMPGGCMLICAVRIRLLLVCQGISLTQREATGLTFVSAFFNAFTPGSTGGDVVKAIYLAKAFSQGSAAVAAILLDRLLGLAGLTLVAFGSFLLLWIAVPEKIPANMRSLLPFFLAFVAAMGGILVLAASRRAQKYIPLRPLLARLPFGLARIGVKVLDAVYAYRGHRGTLVVGLLLSIGVHFLSLGSLLFFALALGGLGNVPVLLFFVLGAVGLLVNAVPVGLPGGVGVGEPAFAAIFNTAGWPHGAALAALLHLGSYFWWAGVGGAFYLFSQRRFAAAGAAAPSTGPAPEIPIPGFAGPADLKPPMATDERR